MTTIKVSASGIDGGQRHLNGVQISGRDYRNLSEPAYAMTETDDVAVPMRDGINLEVDLYRHRHRHRCRCRCKFPALIAFSC